MRALHDLVYWPLAFHRSLAHVATVAIGEAAAQLLAVGKLEWLEEGAATKATKAPKANKIVILE